jgi:uncharacterized phage protein gp47/JayE
MPRFTPKRYEQIFTAMLAKVVTRTVLSDIVDTSVMKHVLAAAARQDDEQYFQMTLLLDLFSIDRASGDDLDERAKDIQPAVVTRNAAVKSSGNVVFSRAGTSGTVLIPAGTKVKTASGTMFTTSAIATITPVSPEQITGHGVGRDSDPVGATADVAGAVGNVASITIIKFDTKPAGVDEVTNLDPFLYGLNRETDDAFRTRLKQYISSLPRSTVEAIEQGVLGKIDPVYGGTVLFVKVVEDFFNRGYFTVYIDDGTGTAEAVAVVTGENVTEGLSGPPPDSATGGEQYLTLNNYPVKSAIPIVLTSSVRGVLVGNTDFTLNPANGQIFFSPPLVTGEVILGDYTHYIGLIQYVQKLVDGVATDRSNYPGLRAAGTLAVVTVPQVLIQTVNATVTVKEGFVQTDVRDAVKEEVKRYINSLGISGDVVRNELVKRIMATNGIYNVVLSIPATDVIMLDDQLPRITDVNITIN